LVHITNNKLTKKTEEGTINIYLLTVLLLCSAATAKPNAMISKTETIINNSFEAIAKQFDNPPHRSCCTLSLARFFSASLFSKYAKDRSMPAYKQ
jgi:lipopolysaccharide biosynthesis glycosyltransferase